MGCFNITAPNTRYPSECVPSQMNRDKKCKDLVKEAFNSRMGDIKLILQDVGVANDLPQDISEYGLSIDFVPANTFEGQREGYTRYQLSWGGPSEEFRVFTTIPRVEFWYLDWYDGASVQLSNRDANIIRRIVGKAEIN